MTDLQSTDSRPLKVVRLLIKASSLGKNGTSGRHPHRLLAGHQLRRADENDGIRQSDQQMKRPVRPTLERVRREHPTRHAVDGEELHHLQKMSVHYQRQDGHQDRADHADENALGPVARLEQPVHGIHSECQRNESIFDTAAACVAST